MNFDFIKDYITEKNAVLVCSNVNRRYLSGFNSSLGYLFISEHITALFVDGRYITAARNNIKIDIDIILLEDIYNQLNDIIKSCCVNNIYVENEISVGQFNKLKDKLSCNVFASQELSNAFLIKRSVKSEQEINFLASAQKIAEAAFDNILNFIKVGISEKEIALQLDYEMRKLGSEGVSFDTICVSGENSALPHGVPTERHIQPGDFVTMDFGAVFGGFHSDMTRTVAVMYASDEMITVYDAVLKAQTKAENAISEGVLCSEIDNIARSVINSAGYKEYFNHSTGHGVGLEIHEYPNLSPKCDRKLLNGQVVTCEPGIYLPDKFGVRIEDMLLVKNNCSQNLTKAPKTLIIL